jgi:hypothetical protein
MGVCGARGVSWFEGTLQAWDIILDLSLEYQISRRMTNPSGEISGSFAISGNPIRFDPSRKRK